MKLNVPYLFSVLSRKSYELFPGDMSGILWSLQASREKKYVFVDIFTIEGFHQVLYLIFVLSKVDYKTLFYSP